MTEYIFELSNDYLLKISHGVYEILKVEPGEKAVFMLEQKGSSARQVMCCRKFEDVIEALIRCELRNEDVNTLFDILNVLQAIYAEVRELKAHIPPSF